MSNAAFQDMEATTESANLAEEVEQDSKPKAETDSAPDGKIDTDGEAEQKMRARPIPRVSIQAFCIDQQTADVFQTASDDRRLAKAQLTVQMGGVDAALAFYENAPTPNLIVLESTHGSELMINDLDRLAEVCDAGTKVVVVGHINDIMLYREMIQKGVSEYIVAPLTPLQVMETISTLYTDPDSDPVGHVIAFVGSKGGVGSSTVCHNCAWAISEAVQTNVVIADFDLPFGTAGLDFNQDPVQGINEALTAPERLDEVLLDRLLSKCSERLSLFSAPGTLEQEYDLDVSACDTVLDIVRQNVPIVAVDVPHIWTSWAKQVLLQSDEIVITAVPDLANLRNIKNLIELLKSARRHDRLPHIVLNQVGMPKRPEISPKDFASAIEIETNHVIEFDAELFGTASNNGQMVEEVAEKSKAAEQFRHLAFQLTNKTEHKQEASKNLLAPLLSRFSRKKAGA